MQRRIAVCTAVAMVGWICCRGVAQELPVTVAMAPSEGSFQAGSRQDFTLTVTVVSPLPEGSRIRVIPPVRRLWSLPIAEPPANEWGVEAQVTWSFTRPNGPPPKVAVSIEQYSDRGPPYTDRDPRREVLAVADEELPAGTRAEFRFLRNRIAADTAHMDRARDTAFFTVQVMAAGSDAWRTVPGLPVYRLLSPPAVGLLLGTPWQVVAGEPFDIVVAAVDRFRNPSPETDAEIAVTTDDPLADPWPPVTARGTTHGAVRLERVVLTSPGPRVITAKAEGLTPAEAFLEVLPEPPKLRLYRGELHSHGALSFDARNWSGCTMRPADMFWYARAVRNLDFAAVTDHSMHNARLRQQNMTEAEFREVQGAAARMNDPGHFVAFTACEQRCARGDTNVYFLGDSAEFYMKEKPISISDLWTFYRGTPVVTIPHLHPKIDRPNRFDVIDPEVERLVEIHSNHGRYEYHENRPLLPGKGMVEGNNVQAILALGHRLGIVAASDDHSGRPGSSDLTAIYAPECTREALFEAMRARHTYGTTGAPIILRFETGDRMMGDEIRVPAGSPLRAERVFRAEVVGDAPIRQVDIVRNGTAVYSTKPDASRVAFEFADTNPLEQCTLGTEKNNPPTAYYYLRVLQVRELGDDKRRIDMAWTSPIFFSPAE